MSGRYGETGLVDGVISLSFCLLEIIQCDSCS